MEALDKKPAHIINNNFVRPEDRYRPTEKGVFVSPQVRPVADIFSDNQVPTRPVVRQMSKSLYK